MIKVYFDDVLIDEDSYVGLHNEYKLFTDSFKLGSTASEVIKLSIDKTKVSNIPTNVRIEDGNSIYHLIVDSIEEDRRFYNCTLANKLLLLNYNYDAKPLIDSKKENEEDCYLHDILEDMCNQVGIEIEPFAWLNDKIIDWWDNRIQARKYLSFIASLQSGYAQILPNGKLTIKPYKKDSIKTINIDECSDFILGEHKVITRVVYDNGAIKWERGYENGATIYLDTNNVYITEENDIEIIYNAIKDFEFYSLEVPRCPMNSSIKAGDIITFTDGVNNYPTIAQYNMSYSGDWIGGYFLKVNTELQEETKIIGAKESVNSIITEINRIDATLKTTAEKTDETTSQLSRVQQTVDGFNERIEDNRYYVDENGEKKLFSSTVFDLAKTVSGVDLKIQQIGGSNILDNCVKQFGNKGWTGNFLNTSNTEIQNNSLSKSALFFMKGTDSRTKQVPNGMYNYSLKYKKLITLANCTVKVNGQTIILDGEGWQEKEIMFEVKSNSIEIEYASDTDYSMWAPDILLIPGYTKQKWSSNPNEIYDDGIELGGGKARFYSNTSDIQLLIDNENVGFQKRSTGEMKTQFTDKGTVTDEITADKGEIAGILMQKKIIDGVVHKFIS